MALISFNAGSQPPSPSTKFVFSYIFPWIFIIGGAIFFYVGLRTQEMAQLSTDWPTVSGTVQSSQVEWRQTGNNHGSSAFAKVVYSYSVVGIPHTADRVLFGDYGSSDSSHANSIVNQYAPGQTVTVHYDPTDPTQAVLQPGDSFSCYVMPLFGLVFLVVGLLLAWFLPSQLDKAVPYSNASVSLLPPDSLTSASRVSPPSDTSINLLPPDQKP